MIPLNYEWVTFLPKIRAKDATYNSSCVRIAKFGCREVWNYFREVIPLTHSENDFSGKVIPIDLKIYKDSVRKTSFHTISCLLIHCSELSTLSIIASI